MEQLNVICRQNDITPHYNQIIKDGDLFYNSLLRVVFVGDYIDEGNLPALVNIIKITEAEAFA